MDVNGVAKTCYQLLLVDIDSLVRTGILGCRWPCEDGFGQIDCLLLLECLTAYFFGSIVIL